MPSKIEWTNETWNPLIGCSKVSEGCENCYAEKMAKRLKAMGMLQYQRVVDDNGWTEKIYLAKDQMEKPLHWKKPRMIFVCSMSDLFYYRILPKQLRRTQDIISRCPQHTFQILTKQPIRMQRFVEQNPFSKNVWLGVSCENQRWADERIPHLLDTPAVVCFVSFEPLLGPVNLEKNECCCAKCGGCGEGYAGEPSTICHVCGGSGMGSRLDWVIIGAESIGGRPGRECKLEWVLDIVRECKDANTPVFVKQVHVHKNGRLILSKDPAEWPEEIRLREYPARRDNTNE